MTTHRKICAMTAYREHGLVDADLSRLECELVRNSCYGSMRLYNEEDVMRAAEEKQVMIENERRAVAAKRKHDAVLTLSRLEAVPSIPHGDVAIPQEVLELVMSSLADMLEPHGIRGPGMIAMDIVNAGLCSRDFYKASKVGLTRLAQLVGVAFPTNIDWDRLTCHPKSMKLPDLKNAARFLGARIGGVKAEVIVSVLGALGVKGPVRVPAQVLRAVLLKRYQFLHPSLTGALDLLADQGSLIAKAALSLWFASAQRKVIAQQWPDAASFFAAHKQARARQQRERDRRLAAACRWQCSSQSLCSSDVWQLLSSTEHPV
eukprot:jgi/Chrzof1/8095/UNPLg00140.t1